MRMQTSTLYRVDERIPPWRTPLCIRKLSAIFPFQFAFKTRIMQSTGDDFDFDYQMHSTYYNIIHHIKFILAATSNQIQGFNCWTVYFRSRIIGNQPSLKHQHALCKSNLMCRPIEIGVSTGSIVHLEIFETIGFVAISMQMSINIGFVPLLIHV